MIKAVLFDLDGTLLNRDDSVKQFIDAQYNRLNKWVGHVSKERYTTRFIELDNQGYVWKDKVYQQLVDALEITHVGWEELFEDYISEFKYSCVPFPHLHGMLEELRSSGFVLGMITNGYGQFQMDNIKALGIESYFETILVSEWEGIKKPDPEIFRRALNKLNVAPNQSIFVGDHVENDIRASENIGMKGIWKRDSQWDKVRTELVIDDLVELPLIVREINKKSMPSK